jgi:hypothetical protein
MSTMSRRGTIRKSSETATLWFRCTYRWRCGSTNGRLKAGRGRTGLLYASLQAWLFVVSAVLAFAVGIMAWWSRRQST